MENSDASNKQDCESLFVKNTFKLNIAAQKEKRFNIVCLSIVLILFIAQYYYFIGYTPIKPDTPMVFIEVPDFNPLIGMLYYLACTLFFALAYPRTKISIVSKFKFANRSVRENSTQEELEKFALETAEILNQRKRVKLQQSIVVTVFAVVTAWLLYLSYNLHNYVELHNDLGIQLSQIDNTQDRFKFIDSNVEKNVFPANLKGYYYNQIIYMDIERQLRNQTSISLSHEEDSKQVAVAILQGQRLNVVVDKKMYLENLSTWTKQSSNGKYLKNDKGEFNGLFLHNQEPLLILGNYLSKN